MRASEKGLSVSDCGEVFFEDAIIFEKSFKRNEFGCKCTFKIGRIFALNNA